MVEIVAETGAAHKKSYVRALALIDMAHKVGADAVKFSAFRPEEMTVDSDKFPFIITKGPWKDRTLYSLYEESALPYDWIPELKETAESTGMAFILSVYHPNTAPLLAEWEVSTVKIASFELGYTELLKAVAGSDVKKVILSTGCAAVEEIETALEILKDKDVTLLYCVSAYPAKPEDMNLNTMVDMSIRFKLPVGLSDHSLGLTAPVAAVTLGACMIEKHLKLDNDNLDASFAVFPDQFLAMVQTCRQTEAILGKVSYDRPKTFHRKKHEGRMVRAVW